MRCIDRVTRYLGATSIHIYALIVAASPCSGSQCSAWTDIAAAARGTAGTGAPVLARGLSAQSSSAEDQANALPTLKSALRSLYKCVHPDLFAEHPAEQVM